MDVRDVLDLFDLLDALGGSVIEQMRAVCDGEDLGEQNSNALTLMRPVLVDLESRGVDTFGLVDAIDEHLAMEAFS